jgi:hypothetical protein
VLSLKVALSPDRLQRLNASNLRADDPQLGAHLQALAQSRHGALFRKSVQTLGALRAAGTQTLWKTTFLPAAVPKSSGPTPVVTSLGLIGDGSVIRVEGSNLMSGGQPNVTPTLSMANCAVQPLPLWTGVGETASDLLFAGPSVPENEQAQLTTTVGAITSKAVSLTYPVQIAPQSWIIDQTYIDYLTPYYEPDPLDEGTSSFAASGNHLSTDYTGPSTSGTDILGIGTKLVNGWTVTAQIVDVHSYMDASSDSGSNNEYRSATISQQPSSGRLETRVSWTYEGGESISYAINWIFSKGAMGTRLVTTQPKETRCTDEQ